MKNIRHHFLFLLILFLVFCCNSIKSNSEAKDTTISPSTSKTQQLTEEIGPLFADTCLSTFEPLGEVKLNNGRLDLILSGKGWNPQYYSCTWPWGELINNEFPSDTTVTDFRIHLVDFDTIPLLDSAFLESEIFKNNLIATYSKESGEEYMTCKFDPNKTGKYPKPKQWGE